MKIHDLHIQNAGNPGKLLVENLSSEHFDLSQYSDAYAKELEKLIDSKVKGKTIVAKPEKVKEETKDLVAALRLVYRKRRAKCKNLARL